MIPPSANNVAPGAPGSPARWTSSTKTGVGTAADPRSSISFTLSHGIINEIYFPRLDKPATRDMGFIVTNGRDFFAEETRATDTKIREVAYGVPAFEMVNTCQEGRFKITKTVVTDPQRDTLLQRLEFIPLQPDTYQLFALLAPHLNNRGNHNDAWVGTFKGQRILYAQRDGRMLAMVGGQPWLKTSVGYVGVSDGWQELRQHFSLQTVYDQAPDGNVALPGEVDLSQGHTIDIAIGFGLNANEAALQALASLAEGFDHIAKNYINGWQQWQQQLHPLHAERQEIGGLFRVSASVLKTHQSKNFPGAMVASLSIPWGETQGDGNESGYHLVWPRDLVESAGGLLALNAKHDVRNILNYLMATQEPAGHWPQNMWLEGNGYWQGLQADETAMPLLLIDLCLAYGVLRDTDLPAYWPTVRKAAGYLIRNGLITQQERWEEQQGISVSTTATLIAAMLVAADLASKMGDETTARYCRETADAWYDSIDTWLYTTQAPLAAAHGLSGYYLHVNPTTLPADRLGDHLISNKNRPAEVAALPIVNLISTEPLALVRFGLRSAKDPRIINTLQLIDAKLKVTTPSGDCWHRYVGDGYGEHPDGSAYDGTGTGRLWPLLTGERAHYEIAAGNLPRARALLQAMEAFSNNGLLPEQIWDRDDIPDRALYFGRPSHSAMPLVWAHAEHIKLVCSIKDQAVIDLPRQAYQRYVM